MNPTSSPPAVQDAIERYHAALEARDYDLMVTAMADDVVLHSPITGRVPISGQTDVRTVVGIVLDAIDDVQTSAYAVDTDTGLIRFSGSVRGTWLEGVDLLRVDADSRIAEITVIIRPLPGLVALMSAIGADIARSNGRPWVARLAALTLPMRGMVWAADRFVVPRALSRR